MSGQISIYGIRLVTRSWKWRCLEPTFSDQPISLSRGFATRSRLQRSKFAASPRTYLTWDKWRNLAEHILQNIYVNDNDPSTHTLHIALGFRLRSEDFTLKSYSWQFLIVIITLLLNKLQNKQNDLGKRGRRWHSFCCQLPMIHW